MVDGNRVILLRMGGLPEMSEIRKNAATLDARLHPLGAEKDELLSMLAIEKGWPADTRILTDQFSPSNLLNAKNN